MLKRKWNRSWPFETSLVQHGLQIWLSVGQDIPAVAGMRDTPLTHYNLRKGVPGFRLRIQIEEWDALLSAADLREQGVWSRLALFANTFGLQFTTERGPSTGSWLALKCCIRTVDPCY